MALKTDNKGQPYADHSESSDAARRAILKLYSYESPLYKAINLANQTRDQRAIPTLGPYAYLLSNAVARPPQSNVDVQKEEAQRQRLGKKNSKGKPLLVEPSYKLPGGKRATIKVFEGDDPRELAEKFCEKHGRP